MELNGTVFLDTINETYVVGPVPFVLFDDVQSVLYEVVSQCFGFGCALPHARKEMRPKDPQRPVRHTCGCRVIAYSKGT